MGRDLKIIGLGCNRNLSFRLYYIHNPHAQFYSSPAQEFTISIKSLRLY